MSGRGGVVLLEVMVALAILGIAGLALLSVAAESAGALGRVEHADDASRSASDFLAVVSLWPAKDLDRRLGARPQGPWLLAIQREQPGLYAVALLDTLSRRAILETALFKPDTTR